MSSNSLSPTMSNDNHGYTAHPPSTSASCATPDNAPNINTSHDRSTSLDQSAATANNAPDSNLNPRSCVTCRRRKVRCNKTEPCSNCVKAGIECVFPGPGRAPRKHRRQPDVEVLSRLRRLEGVVESLGGTDAIEKLIAARLEAGLSTNGIAREDSSALEVKNNPAEPGNKPGESAWNMDSALNNDVHHEIGRLVIDDSKSLYMSDRLFSSLGNQIEELEELLESPSEDGLEKETTPEDSSQSPNQRNHDGFLFGYSSIAHNLRNYHPTPTQAFILYKTYEQNVAAVLSIAHKPTIRNLIVSTAMGTDSIDKSNEALVFAVYLAAVISMPPELCMVEIGEDRDSMITRLRFATEQAMARANLLNSRNINLLQAAVLFLSCVHRLDHGRFVWTMSALVVRLATGLGLHRDGTNFGLSPFETEMRRRLWWHIIILDVRTAEDQGTEPMIGEWQYDTKLPLHINDDDISPDSKTFPTERAEFTDMTCSLVRCCIAKHYRSLNNFPREHNSTRPTLEDRKKIVELLHNILNEKYVQYCDMQEPFQWACATTARLIVAKLWLVVHQPLIKNNLTSLSVEDRNRILLTSIEVIEFTRLMETSEHTRRWSWLFGSYVHWHAIAFVLAELCVRPQCPGVERGWLAIDSTFHEWERKSIGKKGSLWRPLMKLYNKAQAFRARQNGPPGNACPTVDQTIPIQPSQQQQQQQQQQRNSVQTSQGSQFDNHRQDSSSSSSYQRNGSTPQFCSPGQTSDQNSVASAPFNHTPSYNQTGNTQFTPELKLDLSKNMSEILNDFMPAYTMAMTSSSENNIANVATTTTNQMPTTTDVNSPVIATASPSATVYTNPHQTVWPQDMPNAFSMPMEWEQFDDVMRDFQQEFYQVAGQESADSQIRFM